MELYAVYEEYQDERLSIDDISFFSVKEEAVVAFNNKKELFLHDDKWKVSDEFDAKDVTDSNHAILFIDTKGGLEVYVNIITITAKQGHCPKEDTITNATRLYNVVGTDDLEGVIFASCTTHENARQAKELLEAGGWEGMLDIAQDELPLDTIKINDEIITLPIKSEEELLYEKIKRAVFDARADAMEEVLGCELTFATDEDMMDKLDEVLEEKSQDELSVLHRKYCGE